MAQIWTEMPPRRRGGGDGRAQWAVVTLDAAGETFALTGDPTRPVARATDKALPYRAYILQHSSPGGQARWMLYAGPDAAMAVNGQTMALGMRALRDRDEIRLGRSCHLIFSTDAVPHVEPFPGIGHEAICPRCWEPIEVGRAAVRCPRCGVWHHEDESIERACWTHDPVCAADQTQGTRLDGTLNWTPEGL